MAFTNDYLVCNVTNVENARIGRGQSVQFADKDLPNGVLCYPGALITGETHVREAKPTGTGFPWVMARAEINESQYVRTDAQLGIYRMKAGKAQPAWQLQPLDRLEYSDGFMPANVAVGDVLVLPTGFENAYVKGAGTVGDVIATVVKIKDSWKPVMANANNVAIPASYKLVTVEFSVKA